jgi:hypothetical protein
LAVLGLIAGLTVPSVVVAVEKSRTKAVQKETIQIISSVIQDGVLTGDLSAITNLNTANPTDPLVQFFTNKLNAKQCVRGDNTAPCNFNWCNEFPRYDNHSARWVLPNGVQVSIPSGYASDVALMFAIDTKPENNGRSISFTVGGDQFYLMCNRQENTTLTGWSWATSIVPLKGGFCGLVAGFPHSNWLSS